MKTINTWSGEQTLKLFRSLNFGGGGHPLDALIIGCFRHFRKRKKAAFTLAEILITLGMIGVVAAITLPGLYADVNNRIYITRLKRANSALTQAFMRAVDDYGSIDGWCAKDMSSEGSSYTGGLTNGDDCSEVIAMRISEYMPVLQRCTLKKISPCFYVGQWEAGMPYKSLWYSKTGKSTRMNEPYNKENPNAYAAFTTMDGISYKFVAGSNSEGGSNWCSSTVEDAFSIYGGYYRKLCGRIIVDVTAASQPNQWGRDTFVYYMYNNGIMPLGTSKQGVWTDSFETNCAGGRTMNDGGSGCTAWVLMNGNMDYIKCPSQLSWEGRHKCGR